MFGYVAFAVAFLGSSVASYFDLKTTEVPDSVSVATGAAGLALHGMMSLVRGEAYYVLASLVAGLGLLGLGWLLYTMGVWGGADALVLGSIGFAFPVLHAEFSPAVVAEWPFAVTLLFNVFLVGTAYILLFALYKGFSRRDVMEEFLADMRSYWKRLAGITVGFAVVTSGLALFILPDVSLFWSTFDMLLYYLLLLVGLLLLYRYLRVVEDGLMRDEVSTDDLEPGDVLAEDVEVDDGVIDSQRIVGLTEEEVDRIAEARSTVAIKHGVRFVPSFPVALLLSVMFGDVIYWLVTAVM